MMQRLICSPQPAALPRGKRRCLEPAVLRARRPQCPPMHAAQAGAASVHGLNNGNGSGIGVEHAAAAPQAERIIAPAAPAAVPVPAPPAPECALPPAIFQKAVDLGAAKAAYPAARSFLGGVLGGAFIAFGAALALCVGGAAPGLAASNPGLAKLLTGAVGLPFGLLMVVATGAELFTGNTALVTAAVLEGRASSGGLLRSWVASLLGNVVGAGLLVALMVGAGVFGPGAAAPVAVAKLKTSAAFAQAFTKGVLCNWLVCMAVWQATATSSFFGKALACLLPVSAFVAMGLEHSVANAFMIPLGIALGAPVSWGTFLTANLVPVTLGNIVGGALCVAVPYAAMFGALGKGWRAAA